MTNRIDIRDIRDLYPNAHRIDIYGIRKSGKSFTAKCEILDNFIQNDKGFCYVARLEKQLKTALIGNFFDDVLNKAVENYRKQLNDKFNISHADIVYFRSDYWVVDVDQEKKKNTFIAKLGITTAVRDAETFKRRTFIDNINRVIFDEVIPADGRYIPDEAKLLQKIIETLDRNNQGTVITYLLGNPDYDIEMSPYTKNFKFNYAAMPANSAVTFDTEDIRTGKIYKNNIVIVKVAPPSEEAASDSFTNLSGLFSVTETRSSITGEVAHGDYNVIDIKNWVNDNEFVPMITIVQETAVYTESGRYRDIFATIGYASPGRTPAIIIHRHDRFKKTNHIISRYFKEKNQPSTYLYKLNMNAFPKLKKYFELALNLTNVFVEDESTAQTFFNIRKEGLTNPF